MLPSKRKVPVNVTTSLALESVGQPAQAGGCHCVKSLLCKITILGLSPSGTAPAASPGGHAGTSACEIPAVNSNIKNGAANLVIVA